MGLAPAQDCCLDRDNIAAEVREPERQPVAERISAIPDGYLSRLPGGAQKTDSPRSRMIVRQMLVLNVRGQFRHACRECAERLVDALFPVAMLIKN
jgi:hypothetical protein